MLYFGEIQQKKARETGEDKDAEKQRVDGVFFSSVLCSWRCRDEKNKI